MGDSSSDVVTRRASTLLTPAVATAAVVAVSDHAFEELRTATHISDAVAVVAGALCMLMGQPPSWRKAVELMGEADFKKRVADVDPSKVTANTRRIVSSLIASKRLRDYVR